MAPYRISALDGLRGIAVGLVVLYHYGQEGGHGVIQAATAFGWTGVDLFFVMSGFLIGGIVIANRHAANFISVFYLRRFVRIFPLYYLLLIVAAICVAAGLIQPRPLWAYFLYLQNILASLLGPEPRWLQPTWSLAVEEQFYLTLPIVILLVPLNRLWIILVAGIVSVSIFRLFLFSLPISDPARAAYVIFRGTSLLYGVLLALLVKRENAASKATIITCYLGISVELAIFIAASGSLLFTVGMTAIGPLCFFIVALTIMHDGGPIATLTRFPVLQWMGLRTYAIYLGHMPALSVIRMIFEKSDINPHGSIRALALVLTFVLAALSWRLVEAPLIGFGHRFKYSAGVPLPISSVN